MIGGLVLVSEAITPAPPGFEPGGAGFIHFWPM